MCEMADPVMTCSKNRCLYGQGVIYDLMSGGVETMAGVSPG